MSSIEERVQKIVVTQLDVKEEEVTPNASFIDDLGADSLDTVELVMALEKDHQRPGGDRLHQGPRGRLTRLQTDRSDGRRPRRPLFVPGPARRAREGAPTPSSRGS